MGFKMKKPSMTQGTKGHREAVKNIKLNRSMDNTSLPDGRPGSSAFQKKGEVMAQGALGSQLKSFQNDLRNAKDDEAKRKIRMDIQSTMEEMQGKGMSMDQIKNIGGKSPYKALDDRIARSEAKTAKLQGKKEAKMIKGKAKAQAKADKLTQRAEVKEAKAGVKEAKGKYKKRGRKMIKAEKLRRKAAAYTPPGDKKTITEKAPEKTSTPSESKKTAPEPEKKASLTTGTYKQKSTARAESVGKKELPTYKSAYEKVKDKYKDKGGYKQFVTDAEKYWKDKESSPAKNYKNPQDYKVFNWGNKPTPVKSKKKY